MRTNKVNAIAEEINLLETKIAQQQQELNEFKYVAYGG